MHRDRALIGIACVWISNKYSLVCDLESKQKLSKALDSLFLLKNKAYPNIQDQLFNISIT